jgi:hypothetical protein
MGVEVRWEVEGRLLSVRLSEALTITDLEACALRVRMLFNICDAPVHVLADMTEAESLPLNMAELRRVARMALHPALGWTVIYGVRNPVIVFILKTMGNYLAVRYQIMDTREDALGFLYQVDATLKSGL